MRIRKSRCVESNWTHCCIGKFNAALSLCRVLGVTLYFSKGFLEAAAGVSAVVEALQPLGETVVCFLGQKSSLWSPAPQQRYRLFLRYFLHSSLVNLSLLASLEERSTYGLLGCFLGAGDRDDLEKGFLVNGATGDVFVLFWEAMAELEVEAFPCFQEWDSRASFSICLTQWCSWSLFQQQ